MTIQLPDGTTYQDESAGRTVQLPSGLTYQEQPAAPGATGNPWYYYAQQ